MPVLGNLVLWRVVCGYGGVIGRNSRVGAKERFCVEKHDLVYFPSLDVARHVYCTDRRSGSLRDTPQALRILFQNLLASGVSKLPFSLLCLLPPIGKIGSWTSWTLHHHAVETL